MVLDRCAERVRRDLIRLSHAGLEGRTLLTETLARLQGTGYRHYCRPRP